MTRKNDSPHSNAERMSIRCKYIEKALAGYTRRCVKFTKVTCLARALAEDVTLMELEALQAVFPGMKVSIIERCHPSTLLRSKIYRSYLDEWMGGGTKVGVDHEAEKKLNLELLVISNKYRLLERKYLDLISSLECDQRAIAEPKVKNSDAAEAFTIVEKLLVHFKGFLIVEDGALVEPSASRPIIIEKSLYAVFLKWRSTLISS
jgi:hypothetical protein